MVIIIVQTNIPEHLINSIMQIECDKNKKIQYTIFQQFLKWENTPLLMLREDDSMSNLLLLLLINRSNLQFLSLICER